MAARAWLLGWLLTLWRPHYRWIPQREAWVQQEGQQVTPGELSNKGGDGDVESD